MMRGIPILADIIIFVTYIGFFVGFAYFSYGNESTSEETCYANVEVDHPME